MQPSTKIPGIDMSNVIPSTPYTVYEGCTKPGQIPLVVRLIEKLKVWVR